MGVGASAMLGRVMGGPLGLAMGSAGTQMLGRPGDVDGFAVRSFYGAVVPRLYGKVRTAGTVIWSLPPAVGHPGANGRRPYSVSFAIALSSRPILCVGRIWADGSEIRSKDGIFNVATRFRSYAGGGNRNADPLIAAVEGPDAPTYRHLAYAVFEDFSLTAFGNRIPELSFEVEADHEAVGDWVRDLGQGAIDSEIAAVASPSGFAAANDGRVDLENITALLGAKATFHDGRVVARRAGALHIVPATDVVCEAEHMQAETNMPSDPPTMLALSYCDTERQYQLSVQTAGRPDGYAAVTLNTRAAAGADVMRTLAMRRLRDARFEAMGCELTLPWRWAGIEVGDRLSLRGRIWRVAAKDIVGMLIRLRCTGFAGDVGDVAGDGGRSLAIEPTVAPPTRLIIVETGTPLRGSVQETGIWIGARGGDGWRGAETRWVSVNGEEYIGPVWANVAGGTLISVLAAAPADEEANHILLQPDGREVIFETRNQDELALGANLICVGEELIQFHAAATLPNGCVRLSGLMRGRYGTEISDWGVGTIVDSVVPGNMRFLPLSAVYADRDIPIAAYGKGDGESGSVRHYRFKAIGGGGSV